MKREPITTEPHAPILIGRRIFIGGTIAATVAATALGQGREYGQGAAPVRYPDPDLIVLEPRFARYKLGNAAIQRLYTAMLWAEGPAWNGVGRYLVWSDIPNSEGLSGSAGTDVRSGSGADSRRSRRGFSCGAWTCFEPGYFSAAAY